MNKNEHIKTIISARHCDQKLSKTWFHRKKKWNKKIKHTQVTSTIEKCIINTKKAALSFKFMETQVMSGSQDQKEKKNCQYSDDRFFRTKNHHSANSLQQQSLTQKNWWMEQQWTHQADYTSHTLSWKMKKFVPKKLASRMNTKKDQNITSKNKNLVLSWAFNISTTH